MVYTKFPTGLLKSGLANVMFSTTLFTTFTGSWEEKQKEPNSGK